MFWGQMLHLRSDIYNPIQDIALWTGETNETTDHYQIVVRIVQVYTVVPQIFISHLSILSSDWVG